MSEFSRLVNAENGLLFRMRADNIFDEEDYLGIKNALAKEASIWKNNKTVPLITSAIIYR